jgi:DNA topoisomerase-1
MARLKRVRFTDPGIRRRRRGRGFSYVDPKGRTVTDDATVDRIRSLAIPPAWEDVWICADPLGHLQAVGTDAAGRRQYRYHDDWHDRRSRRKFRRMEEFGAALPRIRRGCADGLSDRGLTRRRVLSCAVGLLDRTTFRIGTEEYTQRNGTFGLATLHREHVDIRNGRAVFRYEGKGGTSLRQVVADPDLVGVLRALKRSHSGSRQLLTFREGNVWHEARSADINDFIRELSGGDFTAKDFRTWHATVLAAVELAASAAQATRVTSRRRIVSAVLRSVADEMGNTPAVCRSSYIDPRVFDRFDEGVTIGDRLGAVDVERLDRPDVRRRIERAVLGLLGEGAGAGARIAA